MYIGQRRVGKLFVPIRSRAATSRSRRRGCTIFVNMRRPYCLLYFIFAVLYCPMSAVVDPFIISICPRGQWRALESAKSLCQFTIVDNGRQLKLEEESQNRDHQQEGAEASRRLDGNARDGVRGRVDNRVDNARRRKTSREQSAPTQTSTATPH